MTINPFDLFGIDPHTTTLSQLKRCYYDLALMVHPDRNHDKNGDEMDIVHKAYLYCKEQLEHTASHQTSVEELEKAFQDFCVQQEEQPPSFRDITEDVLEMEKFNKEFEATETPFLASFQGGYGDLMEQSEYAQSNLATCVPYDDTEDKPLKNDFSQLIVYKEPIISST